MKRLLYILFIIALVSCQDLVTPIEHIDVSGAPDLAGNAVAFTAVTPSLQKATRAAFESPEAMNNELQHYKPAINDHGYNYIYTISMFKEGEESTPLGKANYQLAKNGASNVTNGMLSAVFPTEQSPNNPLRWPDNVNKYGFKVVAGKTTIDPRQNSVNNFYQNDRLEGYAFAPVFWVQDDLDELNFHTNKEWYALNKEALGEGKTSDTYKAVPVYLHHTRAWVTIVLKAGKGIPREYLWYSNTSNGFESKLYYYENGNQKPITEPWRREWHVDYDADSNGGVDKNSSNLNTTMIHAIVEPTNYLENPEKLIGQVKLNGMTFTYAPLNDANYSTYLANKDKTGDEYDNLDDATKKILENMQAYNVTAGKHLMITATLSTDKLVLITAQLEDWDEVSMTSVCDDYGGIGKPEEIKTRNQLLDFLRSTKNSPGTTALIVPTELTLDSIAPDKTVHLWPNDLKLNCTLNLASAEIKSTNTMFSEISEGGTLVNGSINIVGKRENNSMEAAICSTNKGTIEQVDVLVGYKKDATKEDEAAAEALKKSVFATKGGLVGTNYGFILNCKNELAVQGTTGYIGGIAGESKRERDGAPIPIIDNCVVNARVGTAGNTETEMNVIDGAGGIAGYAEGRVSRCDFNYGMTLLQQSNTNGKYKNIVQETTTGDLTVNAYGNSWPTLELNKIGQGDNKNENPYAAYNAVLDCQKELEVLLTTTSHSNDGTSRYQIADNFEVDDSWNLGINEDISLPGTTGSGDAGQGISGDKKYHLNFELDGNGKTITTNGKMLFTNINGYFHDFTVYCNKSIISTTNASSTEGIAPLAFSVNGAKAKLANIKVKMASGTDIQASTPSGLVVLAYGGATIENCEVRVDIKVKFADNFSETDAWKYAGGLVACATDVTISGCKVYGGTKIQQANTTTSHKNHYRGGIVGGIVARTGFTPGVIITDCNSWWGDDTEATADADLSPFGSIIGSATYVNAQNEKPKGLIKGKSSGNWWPEKYKAEALMSDTDIRDYIGKRNSITPDAPTDF